MDIKECSSCGGEVEFSPSHKALKCVRCNSTYPIKYTQGVGKHAINWTPSKEKLEQWTKDNKAYQCENCGAHVTFNKYDIATKCQYCEANALIPLADLPGLMPEVIIPFKIDKQQAKQEFYTRLKKRHFLPLALHKEAPTTEIKSTYISSFNFDCFVSATYQGVRAITKTTKDRNGRSKSVTHYVSFSGKIDNQFNNIVVEASEKINQQEMIDIYPYNFAESYDYEDDFVKGYNVGYYNQTVEEAEAVAKNQALAQIDRIIHAKYSNITSLTINPTYSNIKYNYALLPIYFINYNYQNKPYVNVMNGQTGKTTGAVPRSKTQITIFTLFWIFLVLGIAGLIFLLCY